MRDRYRFHGFDLARTWRETDGKTALGIAPTCAAILFQKGDLTEGLRTKFCAGVREPSPTCKGHYRFYEINPLVVKLARTEFTFVCKSPASVDVVIGDGRLSLDREPDRRLDTLVLDAFSGDAVPVHLLAREAFECYFRHLVRPERRVVLAGASPVRVSAGAPGSRLQPSGVIRLGRAECQKPLKERGANQRAATGGKAWSILRRENGSLNWPELAMPPAATYGLPVIPGNLECFPARKRPMVYRARRLKCKHFPPRSARNSSLMRCPPGPAPPNGSISARRKPKYDPAPPRGLPPAHGRNLVA